LPSFYFNNGIDLFLQRSFFESHCLWNFAFGNNHVDYWSRIVSHWSEFVDLCFGFVYFFKGMMTKYYRLMALSFAVVVLYGGMIWYVFPDVDKTISWEGHLAGLITGFVLRCDLKRPIM
jgi:hypothetical protein